MVAKQYTYYIDGRGYLVRKYESMTFTDYSYWNTISRTWLCWYGILGKLRPATKKDIFMVML